jgi:hypothetical protein
MKANGGFAVCAVDVHTWGTTTLGYCWLETYQPRPLWGFLFPAAGLVESNGHVGDGTEYCTVR